LRADFYHLSRTPLEKALPGIAERVLAGGERLIIVARDEAVLARLDEQLWTYRPESFLPHGRSGDQPVLLSETSAVQSGYANIALVDGHWDEAALGFGRAFYFFDETSLDNARAAWRSLVAQSDVERRYWKQDENGRWVEGP
jgi:DNA polymerase-3 subunit chi